MAKTKFKTVDMSEEATQEREAKLIEKKSKSKEEEALDASIAQMASGQDSMMSASVQDSVATDSAPEVIAVKVPKVRGKKYVGARGLVDKTKIYSLKDGIELLKKIKFTKFDESLEVHFVLREIVPSVDVQYPHATGKTLRVSILNDEVMAELEKGLINFDVLLATPAQMGKITKFARTLGPKGLMPNPKNGTLIADPAKRKNELEAGKISLRGEKKAPLLHATVGKISLGTKDLSENVEALVKALGMGKVLKATICSSMSPGIKVAV